MSWRLLPGVQQDTRGHYQVAINSRGKQDRIPYKEIGAEPARMIPVSMPPQKTPRKILTAKPAFDATRRRARVDFRVKGQTDVRTVQDTNEVVAAFVSQHRAVCAMKQEDGKEVLDVDHYGNPVSYLSKGSWDWFTISHLTLKEEA